MKWGSVKWDSVYSGIAYGGVEFPVMVSLIIESHIRNETNLLTTINFQYRRKLTANKKIIQYSRE